MEKLSSHWQNLSLEHRRIQNGRSSFLLAGLKTEQYSPPYPYDSRVRMCLLLSFGDEIVSRALPMNNREEPPRLHAHLARPPMGSTDESAIWNRVPEFIQGP
ncbi:hypothetical protein VFPPC_16469 [Pochonia chlamydosporia 170]|uniref:Uncharacterized protein n=1 Tax=Pochonia chlamydosporia 170 TaxID=1380566 RepID=A0A179FDE6_METCM|nr:hypothetical protein VFPPC_16469 [Pochonia chlamydosporia 170]OAQ63397.1 hypothetical protein VFPPC_16469 [Pochonia chlamydosporia 170]